MNIPNRSDASPCIVLCNGVYSGVMPYKEANKLAMSYAMQGRHAEVLRLVHDTMYAGHLNV